MLLFLFLYLSLSWACEPAICPTNYDPVCGSDGHTYSNLCALNAAHECNATIVFRHDGECTRSCPSVCTKEYQPVCGTNGVTYGNRCMLEVARCEAGNTFEYLQDGPCPDSCPGGTPTPCLVDPCQDQSCPKYPSAQCYAVYCNGCNYEFRTKEGRVVTDCELPEVPCNGPGVRCLVAPCSVQSCPAFPDATCQDDYCTGCNTRWYWEGEEVNCLASCSVSFWQNRNVNRWPIVATSRFNTVFNVPYYTTLHSALRSRSTGRQQKLGVQAVAALLNAESSFGFKYSPAEIKDQVHGAWNNAAAEQRLLRTLTQANSEGRCPL